MGLVLDVHGADRGEEPEPHRGVEVDPADAEPAGGWVGAEGDVPVEEGGQVPAPGERVDVGELHLTAEVDEESGPDQVTDR
ncbi:hypothetical protein [Streptomyces sp. NPDC059949]|uniref:hypothetical protein n=1 Tax=Streptomyces sp. NPDC059949 TaxID=3347013 RepID=UPI003664814C